MHSMAEYYVEGEQAGDTTRLGRIFDIIADVKVSLWNLCIFYKEVVLPIIIVFLF